jgi:molecular chaperone HscB
MQNFFILFNIEERFDIDLDELDMRYFELQAKYHPDRSSDVSMGILVNEGYKILQDNFERANHILELHGIFVTNNQLAPKLSPTRLEHILDIIENINEHDPIPEILKSIRSALGEHDYEKAALHVLELRYVEKGML